MTSHRQSPSSVWTWETEGVKEIKLLQPFLVTWERAISHRRPSRQEQRPIFSGTCGVRLHPSENVVALFRHYIHSKNIVHFRFMCTHRPYPSRVVHDIQHHVSIKLRTASAQKQRQLTSTSYRAKQYGTYLQATQDKKKCSLHQTTQLRRDPDQIFSSNRPRHEPTNPYQQLVHS